jgi:general stress protein YciG
MAIQDRGFASMDPNVQRRIASKGGKVAHLRGHAHEWTHDEAVIAGRKGGAANHRRLEAVRAGAVDRER